MSWTIREAIKNCLLQNTELAALVPDSMIWSQFAPLGTTIEGTWIVMTKISSDETGAHDGNGNLTSQRYQFTVGGTNGELIDRVVNLLIQEFNAVNINFTDEEDQVHEISFYNAGSQDGWESDSRVYSPTVDMLIMANY